MKSSRSLDRRSHKPDVSLKPKAKTKAEKSRSRHQHFNLVKADIGDKMFEFCKNVWMLVCETYVKEQFHNVK